MSRKVKRRMIVGLCGPMGAGKTTAANFLVQTFCDRREPFAGPLKQALEVLGIPDRHLYGTPDEKAQPLALLCGKSARQAMQTLGTEWGRQHVGEGFWANVWRVKVEGALRASSDFSCAADDVRFSNEADAIHALGGFVVCVVRSRADLKKVAAHPSEDFTRIPYDFLIVNDGTVANLQSKLRFRASRWCAA